MLLVVVRHGQTDWNRERRYMGTADLALNQMGFRQARALAERLRADDVEIVVSSPLTRALQTARVILEAVSAPMVVMPEFRERGMGVFEGLTRDDARAEFPESWEWQGLQQPHATPPRAETSVRVRLRVTRGLEALTRQYGGAVVLVTHAFVARTIFAILRTPTDAELAAYKLGNGELTAYHLALPAHAVVSPGLWKCWSRMSRPSAIRRGQV